LKGEAFQAMFPGVPVMRGSRAAVFALGAAAFTLTVLAFSALADVSETQPSRSSHFPRSRT